MRMCLEDDRTGTHDFSTLASQIPRRADLLETTMWGGQRLHLRESTLAGGLSGSIYIDDVPLLPRPVPQAAEGSKRFPSYQILLKERSECLYTRLIKGSEEAGKGCTMGQLVSTKQGHERLGKRQQPFVKRLQRGFPRQPIADEHYHKIDEVVVPKARSGEAHLFLDRFQDTRMGENLSKGGHFAKP